VGEHASGTYDRALHYTKKTSSRKKAEAEESMEVDEQNDESDGEQEKEET
jgi:hypothetical protein